MEITGLMSLNQKEQNLDESGDAYLFEAFVLAPCLFTKHDVELDVGNYTLKMVTKDYREVPTDITRMLMIIFSTVTKCRKPNDTQVYLTEKIILNMCFPDNNADTEQCKRNRTLLQMSFEELRKSHLEIKDKNDNIHFIKLNFIDYLELVVIQGIRIYSFKVNDQFYQICKKHKLKFDIASYKEQNGFIEQSMYLLGMYKEHKKNIEKYYLTSHFIFKALGYDFSKKNVEA